MHIKKLLATSKKNLGAVNITVCVAVNNVCEVECFCFAGCNFEGFSVIHNKPQWWSVDQRLLINPRRACAAGLL